ncbi:MAG: pyrophosphate--fructose-6-phosphate 1-phosphotransferase [Puniceicoccales bacterium]|jgi:pyrophosphate--fructose-6-phosphate 1-phosphotransferase|nr:pyrophosphate--fructose-6-phosphate 1-phosphotransferase [Puniceicoccales bacterium]
MRNVAILTAGGLAPCLSSSIAFLIEEYSQAAPDVNIICYKSGYKGLLLGDLVTVSPLDRELISRLHDFGGSPIGNSRVKLTNIADCVKRGLVREGDDPLQVAANQLIRDNVSVLHTIGGDDTNTAAADLAKFLKTHGYDLQVLGLPKTVDNDVYPIKQSLGAWTAAAESAKFFEHIVAENTANPRMLIVHEIMGRHCGWLTAQAAIDYRNILATKHFLANIGLSKEKFDIHGVYVPELPVDVDSEAARLKATMDGVGNVNIFVSEGAGIQEIVEIMRKNGEDVPVDAFGHIKLDAVNPGKWFASQFAEKLSAEKVLVQKSGYFARSSKSNVRDLELIRQCAKLAVESALGGASGVIGLDEDDGDALACISFDRIRGGKPFDAKNHPEFAKLLREIGQMGRS